jgi:hypothetical protein
VADIVFAAMSVLPEFEADTPDRDVRRRAVSTRIVWLDNSRRSGRPIRRRWRLLIGGRVVLSVPMTTVEWSR